jgi:hypothetical protein
MSTAPSTDARFAVCIRNDDYPASLEPRKLYQVVADADAETQGLLRVVDESGEDYLYPAAYFLPVPVSPAVGEALLKAS